MRGFCFSTRSGRVPIARMIGRPVRAFIKDPTGDPDRRSTAPLPFGPPDAIVRNAPGWPGRGRACSDPCTDPCAAMPLRRRSMVRNPFHSARRLRCASCTPRCTRAITSGSSSGSARSTARARFRRGSNARSMRCARRAIRSASRPRTACGRSPTCTPPSTCVSSRPPGPSGAGSRARLRKCSPTCFRCAA